MTKFSVNSIRKRTYEDLGKDSVEKVQASQPKSQECKMKALMTLDIRYMAGTALLAAAGCWPCEAIRP